MATNDATAFNVASLGGYRAVIVRAELVLQALELPQIKITFSPVPTTPAGRKNFNLKEITAESIDLLKYLQSNEFALHFDPLPQETPSGAVK